MHVHIVLKLCIFFRFSLYPDGIYGHAGSGSVSAIKYYSIYSYMYM